MNDLKKYQKYRRYVSLTGADHCNSKLPENIHLKRGNHLFFVIIQKIYQGTKGLILEGLSVSFELSTWVYKHLMERLNITQEKPNDSMGISLKKESINQHNKYIEVHNCLCKDLLEASFF